ncbi:MAG: S-layer homology domain-containing protein [Armatimonadetes bacterium]|nr:S-layer homology domain-containing protein [Armatimonadota bacterium]
MVSLAGIVCGLVMFGGQGAPADVPRSHWAFSAVDEMFQEGLLVGYPTGSLRLDRKLAFDQKFVTERLKRWRRSGLMVGFPDGLGHVHGQEDSRYMFAVATYTCYTNATGQDVPLDGVRAELRDLARVISMLSPELDQLGADVPKMIRDLNQLESGKSGSFRG